MEPITINVPEDVAQIIHSLAAKAGVEVDEFFNVVFGAFVHWFQGQPAFGPLAAKRGWDIRLMFADFVRQEQEAIWLNWLLTNASVSGSSPAQRVAAFQAWVDFPRGKLPVLSEEALHRESLYGK